MINKKQKLSKGSEIVYDGLECQNYLKSASKLSNTLMKQIFMIRSRNLPIWCNFPNKNTLLQCCAPLCQSRETQSHLYECLFLEPRNIITNNDVQYKDVFSKDVQRQVFVTRVLMQKFESRQTLLSSVSGDS